MFVITVEFTIKPAHIAEFMPAMIANAKASLDNEPGCHQFDVCVAVDDPNRIFLYEIYADRAAFDHHLATLHFKAFDARARDWVLSKIVKSWQTAVATGSRRSHRGVQSS